MPSQPSLALVSAVQSMLSNLPREVVTIDLIRSSASALLVTFPNVAGADLEWVEAELIRRGSVWVESAGVLSGPTDQHEEWLFPGRKEGWRYTARYLQWLRTKGLPEGAIEGLDRDTDQILRLLEDPKRVGPWDRRGLVVGHVQSGKTSNYTGLINKAADAGYKIILVLAGLHNNLRSQTQQRLDEGFLGFESGPHLAQDAVREVGVGLIDRDPTIRPNFATNRSEKGDFSRAAGSNLGISPEQRPWLFVVKKNKRVLTHLLTWVRNHVANEGRGENRKVTHLPLLVIDDEADNASVDTAADAVDEEGVADPDHEPTAINRLIRRILRSFDRAAYVGYTATPFANIFIHDRAKTDEEGRDLFPEAFIINLRAPSNYVGPREVFGIPSEDGRHAGLPLVRCLDERFNADFQTWLPQGHANGQRPTEVQPDGVPPSLVHAIHAFLVGLAVRQCRDEGGAHGSMLVHVTRFQSVQVSVARQIEEYVGGLKQRMQWSIDADNLWARLREIWETDFVPTAHRVGIEVPSEAGTLPSWDDLKMALPEVVQEVEVRTINGSAKDVLDYTERKSRGLKVIAVGGDKLSRGLTLEGLTVSFFLRASRMYDTLMQMGRWFGYRTGYLELCRLYTPRELTRWFALISDASSELREDFDLMMAVGGTPRDFGLRVQQHPSLQVTAAIKMRSGRELSVSFAGDRLETILFRNDSRTRRANLDAFWSFVGSLGNPTQSDNIVAPRPSQGDARWLGNLWKGVAGSDIVAFLRSYQGHPEAYKANTFRMSDYIEKMMALGELTAWTVACVGSRDFAPITRGSLKFWPVRRSPRGREDTGRIGIGVLVSRRDEAIDLDAAAWQAACHPEANNRAAQAGARTRRPTGLEGDVGEMGGGEPLGPAIRWVRGRGDVGSGVLGHPERGLLLIYLIVPKARSSPKTLEDHSPLVSGGTDQIDEGSGLLVGFGVSFPYSQHRVVVKYQVNNLFWSQES